MKLNGAQKNYIKQNIWQVSPAEIASALGIPEREIHDYLKKRWRPEKYEKYISRFSENPEIGKFSLKKFLIDNKNILLLLAGLVFVTYVNSLGNDFVSDDLPAFPNNPDLANFGNVTSSVAGAAIRIFYYFAYKISGLYPLLFRLPNLLFHFGSTVLAFLILSFLTKRPVALIAAALFAVHPILSESVTWISGGIYAYYSFLFLLSFAAYILADQNRKYYYVSLVALLLSISISEKATVLAPIFVLYELAFGNLKRNWKKIWPYFAISFALGLLVVGRVGERVNSLQSSYYLEPGYDNIFIKIPTAVASYLWLIIWPQKLTLYHTEMSFTQFQFGLAVLVFVLYLAAIVWGWRKNKMVFFWLSFFLIPLAPTLTPLRVAWVVAERYAYLGTLGVLVVIAWLFYKAASYEKLKIPVYTFLTILILALSARTIVRNIDWKNEDNLWPATVKTSPSGPNIHNNMGDVYGRQKNFKKAAEEFKKAIEINPKYADAYHNLANTYQQMDMLPEAVENYQKALEINPMLWQSHQNMAFIYYKQGRPDQAGAEIKKALEINPNDPTLRQNIQQIENNLKNPQPINGPVPSP